jgi:hypothetical protein
MMRDDGGDVSYSQVHSLNNENGILTDPTEETTSRGFSQRTTYEVPSFIHHGSGPSC